MLWRRRLAEALPVLWGRNNLVCMNSSYQGNTFNTRAHCFKIYSLLWIFEIIWPSSTSSESNGKLMHLSIARNIRKKQQKVGVIAMFWRGYWTNFNLCLNNKFELCAFLLSRLYLPPGTPVFPHWHRLMTLQFEQALQKAGALTGVPYWDWTEPITSVPAFFNDRSNNNPFYDYHIKFANQASNSQWDMLTHRRIC